jgi:hypothetical protein
MVGTSDGPLDALRWHWGSAYLIHHPMPDVWIAERRDDHETLRADSPERLLDLIRKDYSDRPVSRAVSLSVPRQDATRPRLCPNL